MRLVTKHVALAGDWPQLLLQTPIAFYTFLNHVQRRNSREIPFAEARAPLSLSPSLPAVQCSSNIEKKLVGLSCWVSSGTPLVSVFKKSPRYKLQSHKLQWAAPSLIG